MCKDLFLFSLTLFIQGFRVAKDMKKHRPEKAAPRSDIKFPVGSSIIVLRPNLWHGTRGEVVAETNGIHRCRLAGLNGETFHCDAPGEQLQIDL